MKQSTILTTILLAVAFSSPTFAADKNPAASAPSTIVEPEMVKIPAGGFVMGCRDGRDIQCDGDEKPAHTVRVNEFMMGKYEVTQGQWKAVMGANPSEFSECGDTCPVENVSWNEIQVFIQKLNTQTGKQYRLPNEAEWEYACRAGVDQTHCGGGDTGTVAWYASNSGKKTHPVGGKQANAWGLYDMSGNVWESVQDGGWHENYHGAPTDGSVWLDTASETAKHGGVASHALRGGSWNDIARFVRSSYRSLNAASYGDDLYGFRLARSIP
jgi:formylglycine-generating enzyme required for sulfatase activity